MQTKRILKKYVLGTGSEVVGVVELTIASFMAVLAWRYQNTLDYASAADYFFWPSLGPVLIALRYGFGRGLICLLLMILMNAGWDTFAGDSTQLSMSVILGTALVTMLAGEFRDNWYTVNQQQRLNQKFVNSRLDQFTQSYHLLKVSHDQLEQRLAGQQVSLRTAVQEIRHFRSEDGSLTSALAEQTLTVISKIITLHQAGFYEVTDGVIVASPIAVRGQKADLNTDDPMVREACEDKITVAIRDISEEGEGEGVYRYDVLDYQLVIPLVDVNGNMKAIIAAKQVRFIQLVKNNIALVHLLASYIANLLSTDVLTPKLLPEQQSLFLQYLKNQETYFDHFFADSAIVAFSDTSDEQLIDLDYIVNYRRGADVYWITRDRQGQQALVVLMPVTGLEEAEQFVLRIKKLLNERTEHSMQALEVYGPLLVNRQREQVEILLDKFGAYRDDFSGPVHTDS